MAASKYVDPISVMQVIGCVYNNPSLLDATDKYNITEEDFDNDFHRIVFGSIYKVYELGAKKITLENISDFLSSRPKSEAVYKQQKGDEWLLKVAENAIPASFDYYYGRLKKFSLLRAYDKYGVDVKFIYDPDNILDTKKKQLQEEQLDNATLDEIAQKIDNLMESIRIQYVDDVYQEAMPASDGIEELLAQLKQRPEAGVPMYGSLINTVTRGARLGAFYLRSAATGLGKAIPNSTIIVTPDGKRRVDEINVGDYLFGRDGKKTQVLQIYPQPEPKQIYRITFSDGRIAECCDEHLWGVYYGKRNTYKVLNTKQIYEDILENGTQYKHHQFRYKIPINEPVEYEFKDFYCPPYVMGAILGDGCLVDTPNNHILLFSSADIEIIQQIEKELGVYGIKRSGYNWIFRKELNNKFSGVWTKELLKEYPELVNTHSDTKFIPKDYFYGSIDQRIDLLNGLLDTDGSVDKSGRRITYFTISEQLKNDVKELCQSLGIIVTEGQDNDGTYILSLRPTAVMRNRLFRLTRKRNRISQNTSNCRNNNYLYIKSIEPTGNYTEMTCFTVDNPEHLFLMNDYIVTHNTRTMVADACYIACDEIYNDTLGMWVKNGVCQPTLYIATEQDLSEMQTMMLAFLASVNEEHILNGRYEGDEEDRITHAIQVLKKAPLYIVEIPDFSLRDIEDIIKKNIREHNVHYIFYDYIHTSMKILEEISRRSGGIKLREDNVLFMLSTRLKDICNQYGVFILSSTQLNADYQVSETPDQNLLRGAKSIADRIDWGSILLKVTNEDLESLAKVLQSSSFEKPTHKLSVYKNRRGRYNGIYLWCKGDLGTCRINPMFATSWNYELIQMEDFQIEIEEGAF